MLYNFFIPKKNQKSSFNPEKSPFNTKNAKLIVSINAVAVLLINIFKIFQSQFSSAFDRCKESAP